MTAGAQPVGVRIGELNAGHRERLEAIVRGTGSFREQEVEVALEVFDSGLGLRGAEPDGDYQFVGGFAESGELLGYAAFGPTPVTEGTWDLYWIAVDKTAQGKGAGRALLAEVESRVVASRGRMLLIETSSRTDYEATRTFYAARGYAEQARIRDFYAVDDDRVMLTKTFTTGRP
jgi:ribosomal protein S18 acetylase RimI-like enzyme